MTDPPCPVCGAKDRQEKGRLAGRRLVRCPECGLHRALALSGPSRTEPTGDPAPSAAEQPEIARRLARGRIDFSGRLHAGQRLLALGPGAGPLIEAAREAGLAADSLPGSPAPEGFPSLLDRTGGGYDLIWLPGLIERLPDPLAALSGLDRLLASGGLALVETWTSESPAFQSRPAGWWSEHAPGAAAIYDRSSLARVMDRLGCPVRRWYYPSLPGRVLAVCAPEEIARDTGPRRVLLQRFIALGDVILTTPIIRALQAAEPGTEIWVQTVHGEVFRDNPRVSGVITGPAYLCFDDRFELAYEYTPDLHAVTAYARQAGVAPAILSPELYLSRAERTRAASLLADRGVRDGETVIGLHAATSWPERTWAPTRWDAVAWDLAVVRGVKVVVLGQPADGEVAPLPGVIDLRGSLSLRDLMGVISRLDGLIGADSGLLHIAIALKTPLVGLFGCVPAAKRLPETGDFVALEADLPCADCLARRPIPSFSARCERETVDCMAAITVEQVLTAAERVLAATGRDLPPARGPAEIEDFQRRQTEAVLDRNRGRLELRSTPDGHPSLRVLGPGGKWRTLHSLRRPVEEAEQWAAGLDLEPDHWHLVLGAGLGYHLEALARRWPRVRSWLVVEPDADVFKLGLLAGHTGRVLGNMSWHVGDDLTALALKIDRASGSGRFGRVLIHPPSAGLHPALFRVIQERLAPLVFHPETG